MYQRDSFTPQKENSAFTAGPICMIPPFIGWAQRETSTSTQAVGWTSQRDFGAICTNGKNRQASTSGQQNEPCTGI
jgi:hypothetical protein